MSTRDDTFALMRKARALVDAYFARAYKARLRSLRNIYGEWGMWTDGRLTRASIDKRRRHAKRPGGRK